MHCCFLSCTQQLPGALFDILAAKGLVTYLSPVPNQPSSIKCIKYMTSVMLEASFTNRYRM